MAIAFAFLSDEEFAALGRKDRAAYLVRAHQELAEQQRVLRDQLRRTVAVVDQDATVRVGVEREEKKRQG